MRDIGNSLASVLASNQNTGKLDISIGSLSSGLSPKRGGGDLSMDDELLQAKIDHLERERVELSLQLHMRDEKERARKIRVDQLESQLRAAEASRAEILALFEASKRDKDALERRLQTTTEAAAPAASAVCGGTTAKDLMMLNSAPAPAYLSGTEATQGLWSKMTAASRELKRMEEENRELQREKDEAAAQLGRSAEEVAALKAKIEKGLAILREKSEIAEASQRELEEAHEVMEAQQTQLEACQEALAAERASCLSLRQGGESLQERVEELEAELADTQARLIEAERPPPPLPSSSSSSSDDDSLSLLIGAGGENSAAVLAAIDDLRRRLHESEQRRKKLHSQLQDLRGNVRVLVRCRPFLRGDGDGPENRVASIACNKDGASVTLTSAGRGGQTFAFDQVFGQESTQEAVFRDVSELVQSAVDGFRVCIFSYGQTGSGKTWTMSGERAGTQRGIIPRAVEQILQQAVSMREAGWEMGVTASVVELYNEDLRDLLAAKGAEGGDRLKVSNLQGRVTVAGLTTVDIDCAPASGLAQMEGLLETARKARITISTGMNEQSSRSHMLVMLELTARHRDGTTVTRGGLRLVDLAGSERLDRTGTLHDAARLKETVNINKSLSCLADVFVALGHKQQHVPYRNSKLTMLLQDCMSGDGKSMMIVNVSPTPASAQETLCSLRFANQVCPDSPLPPL